MVYAVGGEGGGQKADAGAVDDADVDVAADVVADAAVDAAVDAAAAVDVAAAVDAAVVDAAVDDAADAAHVGVGRVGDVVHCLHFHPTAAHLHELTPHRLTFYAPGVVALLRKVHTLGLLNPLSHCAALSYLFAFEVCWPVMV